MLKTLYITGPEWTVGHITSVTECDEALQHLEAVVESIQGTLVYFGKNPDPDWLVRTERTLRLRKKAIQAVQTRRRELKFQRQNRREFALLNRIKELDPHLFFQALSDVPF